MTGGFLAAHTCAEIDTPPCWANTHECWICLLQHLSRYSIGFAHSKLLSSVDFWTVTEAYVKGAPVSHPLINVGPPTGYWWRLSTQQLADIHHHISLSLPQLLQHHHGGGLRRYGTACCLPGLSQLRRREVASFLASVESKIFLLASSSSVISVTRPLDYEQVPNGMIRLRVMAKDGGKPALNSTVPVTVEVIVSVIPHNTHRCGQGQLCWMSYVISATFLSKKKRQKGHSWCGCSSSTAVVALALESLSWIWRSSSNKPFRRGRWTRPVWPVEMSSLPSVHFESGLLPHCSKNNLTFSCDTLTFFCLYVLYKWSLNIKPFHNKTPYFTHVQFT